MKNRERLGNIKIESLRYLSILIAFSSVFGVPLELLGEEYSGTDIPGQSERIRPGAMERDSRSLNPAFNENIYDSIQDPNGTASDFIAVPDRWRQFYKGNWYDPYNQNILKGDLPIFGSPGHEWFFEGSLISDSQMEIKSVPIPVGGSSTNHQQSLNTLGRYEQSSFSQNLSTRFSLIRGNTVFKPPEFELRVAPVFNYNYADTNEVGALRVNPASGTYREDSQIGFQELFVDAHLLDISHRYDFISTRVGIQRFNSDFRGFVFNDDAPGARLFGTWDANRYQYNLAWFNRLEKDTNSNLNTTFRDRYEDVLIGNLYLQDRPVLGHNLQFSALYREDKAGNHPIAYDQNGFLVRPAAIGNERLKNIYNTYLGVNTDGHIGKINTTGSFYYTFGSESNNQIAQRSTEISAMMSAVELSYDIDWVRIRSSIFYSSGDSDPTDGRATGFDSISDSPNFAGGDLSYWQRQGIPLIGGGGVNLVNNLSLLPSLRAGKQQGQANFVNPGLLLYNAGIDFELTPKLKLINNVSYLRFDHTEVLEMLRQDGSIDNEIGFDFSSGILYRPFLNNNVQVRLGVAALLPGAGLRNLYGSDPLYDAFSNLILAF